MARQHFILRGVWINILLACNLVLNGCPSKVAGEFRSLEIPLIDQSLLPLHVFWNGADGALNDL